MTHTPRKLSRRQFDRHLALFGGVMLAACHEYRPACVHDLEPDPLEGYEPRFLTRAECLTLAAATEVLVAECPPVISAGEVARRADRFLASLDAPAKSQARLAIAAVEDFGGVLALKLKGFSQLSLEDRRTVLDRLMQNRGLQRDVVRVFKMLTLVPYYSHPEVRRAIGFVDFEQRPSYLLRNTGHLPLPMFSARKSRAEPAHFG
jgi:hypothetical protein